MPKTEQRWRLVLSEARKKRRPVEKMEDLVVGHEISKARYLEFTKRFWDTVTKGEDDECWIWNGETGQHGHGRFWILYRRYPAHRFSFLLKHGKIDPKLLVMHECDNPPCVNPNHLFQGTHKDNTHDAMRKHRLAHGERHAMRKLTTEDVVLIRKEFASGRAWQALLARRFGVTDTAISYILKRKTWRRVP